MLCLNGGVERVGFTRRDRDVPRRMDGAASASDSRRRPRRLEGTLVAVDQVLGGGRQRRRKLPPKRAGSIVVNCPMLLREHDRLRRSPTNRVSCLRCAEIGSVLQTLIDEVKKVPEERGDFKYGTFGVLR